MSGDPVAGHVAKSERQRGNRQYANDRERQPQRTVNSERDRQRGEQHGERPGKRRREPTQPQPTRDQGAGNQQARRCRPEPQGEAESVSREQARETERREGEQDEGCAPHRERSSEPALPEESQRAASR